MTPSIESRSARSPGADRNGSRRVATGAGHRAGAEGRLGEEARSGWHAASVEQDFDWDGFAAPPPQRRAQPAELLYAMIERMGGMPSSHWKGKYVNLVI